MFVRGMLAGLLAALTIAAGSGQDAPKLVRIGRISPATAGLSEAERDLTVVLGERIPGHTFEYVKFTDVPGLLSAATNGQIEFAQVNPSVFVELEVLTGATPIASIVFQPRPGLYLQTLGGVAFCREEERDLRQLKDLRGKRIAAPTPEALGGTLALLRELKAIGIRPEKDLKELRYLGSQQRVIEAVLSGAADCGFAASNSFATALGKELPENKIRILPPPQPYPELRNYPVPVSTRLYPSSTFAKMRNTPILLADQVAVALLSMPPMTRRQGFAGWSVALNYESVHDCLRELGIAPYERYGKVTMLEAVRQHWYKVVLGLVLLVFVLAGIAGRVIQLNRRLRLSKSALKLELERRALAEQERERLEAQLRQSQKLESVGRLAGGVAHDFNNLLTVINGYSAMTLGQIGDHDASRPYLSAILEAGENAAKLTQQLLAFSRKQVVDPKPLNLNNLVSETGKLLRRVVGEDVEIVTVLAPSLGLVMADPVQIQQVLLNLAVNARDAMPNGGKLVIETAELDLDGGYAAVHPDMIPGPYIMMAITDTGEGMSAEVQQHLFEPFYTTKERGKGTGLGLSMVYGIVRQSGGWIWVYSEPGKGSTFKIYLPRTGESAECSPVQSPPPAKTRASDTVLVVEDQEEVRRIARHVLEAYGYRVLEAASGEEALTISQQHDAIDLLLTDVVLPGITGREVAAQLVPQRPRIKVLFMSGYAENVIAHQGVLDSGVAFLPKPFTPEALATKVHQMLHQPVE